jgi:NTP pyrophosphatase (non-canonical NTP hydrolase)
MFYQKIEQLHYFLIIFLNMGSLNMETNAYNEMPKKSFSERIKSMNEMYKLPINTSPTLPGDVIGRLTKFKTTLFNEVDEINDIAKYAIENESRHTLENENEVNTNIAVAIADLLGDVIVYCYSEALKYGIPLEEVLDIIMDSNESKLDENGEPIYDENGKFLKGPSYWKPEPLIKELLSKNNGVQKGTW